MALTNEERKRFEQGVAAANIPTLLMVLVQLTGKFEWLEAPYLPVRQRGLDDNDTGGLNEALQREIREAALEAIVAWKSGREIAIADPSRELLIRMLSVASGEPVPDEFAAITSAQLGQTPIIDSTPADVPAGFKVLIIGAGVSGICAAVYLEKAGIPYVVIERNPTVGGVWLENRYPGAGVDSPNHLYSYSFAPGDWGLYFCLRDELKDYLEGVSREFGVRENMRFDTTVERIEYHAESQTWKAEICGPDRGQETLEANVVISAAGLFNPPIEPDIPGLDEWSGEKWHTARWPANAELAGKRVAIIGNGASGMQVGPEIQHQVKALTIFQRSKHWVSPHESFRRPVPEAVRFLFREVPLYRDWYRVRLCWAWNDKLHATLHKDPDWPHPERSINAVNDRMRIGFTEYIKAELGDRADDLLDKVLPTYPPFGKRMLLDNGWYRMLRNEKVTLVDDPIDHIKGNRIVTKGGTEVEADVLVMATGFDAGRMISTYDIVGRSGATLCEAWDVDDPKAYLGTVVPDFPNFFVLYGPNLQPGHGGSLIFTLELQVRYVLEVIRKMADRQLGSVEIRQEVYDRYNDLIDAAHEDMVWTHPGMSSYYRNCRGRVTVNSPHRNVDYYAMTRSVNLDEFRTESRCTND